VMESEGKKGKRLLLFARQEVRKCGNVEM